MKVLFAVTFVYTCLLVAVQCCWFGACHSLVFASGLSMHQICFVVPIWRQWIAPIHTSDPSIVFVDLR